MAHIQDWRSLSEPDPEWTEATGGQSIDLGAFPDIQSLRQWIISMKPVISAELDPSTSSINEYDELVKVQDGSSIICRIYRPQTPPSDGSPLFVIYHGGGWCVGEPEGESALCRLLVSKFGVIAVNVDYRLAPEHKFPIALSDCVDATKWAVENASALGADPAKGFLVSGTSAGGGIAAAISYIWRDEGITPRITGQHLMIPFLVHSSVVPEKYRADYLANAQHEHAPILSGKAIALFISNYISLDEVGDPRFSPLLFSTGHSDLPPTYFQVCGRDPLRDDALIFERILREEENIKTKIDVYPGLPHGFWGVLPKMKASRKFVADSVDGVGWLLQQK